jgi:hypothetical protein
MPQMLGLTIAVTIALCRQLFELLTSPSLRLVAKVPFADPAADPWSTFDPTLGV